MDRGCRYECRFRFRMVVYLYQSLLYQPSWLKLYRLEDVLHLGSKVSYFLSKLKHSNVVMGVFAVFFIPETKDRSLEEIDEMFMVGLPAWKFKGSSAIYVVNVRLCLYWNRCTSCREER